MLNAQPSQFRLTDDGSILFQPHPTNPLPGEAVAKIRKGQTALAPEADLLEHDLISGLDRAAAKDFINAWLKGHIKETLGALADLADTDALAGPARGICFQLYEAMGIVPRENLEDLIGSLTPEMRQQLRAKQVRLGPVLVFLPALNKPAAVRLRGLLWSLWNDRALPATLPPDGMVSLKIDARAADRRFYQAIGYPVYGPRAIRIDMLDRVISAVYDNAKEGKFRAEHKMAEWLGSSIDDLYAVLEAMGHRKIEEEKPVEAVAEVAAETATEAKPDEEKSTEAKHADVKPELAMFRLKKGKAFQKPVRKDRPEQDRKDRPRKGGKPHSKKQDQPRVLSAGPSTVSESPFAVLGQLKKKDASGS